MGASVNNNSRGDERGDLLIGFSKVSESASPLVRAISDLIMLFTDGPVSHAFLLWRDPHMGCVCLGANPNGVTLDVLEDFERDRVIVKVARPVKGSLWPGLEALRNDLNERYNIGGVIGMSVVEIARRVFHDRVTANPLSRTGELFCSQFVLEVIIAAKLPISEELNPSTTDPSQLMRALEADDSFEMMDPGDVLPAICGNT